MTRRPGTRVETSDLFVAAYMLAWLLANFFLRARGGWATLAVDVSYFGIGLLTISTQLRAARSAHDAASRRAWHLLAASSALIVGSYLVWALWEPVFGVEMSERWSHVTDVLYLPAAFLGFLAFPADAAFKWSDVRARLDGLLFAVGGAVFSWHFAIEPRALSPDGAALGAVLEWLLAIAASFALLRARDQHTRDVVGLGLSAHLIFILTDYFAWRLPESALNVTLIDSLFFVAWCLRWLGARRAVGAPRERPIEATGYRGSLAPSLFVASAYGLLLIAIRIEEDRDVRAVAITAVGMTALLLVRQYLSLRENAALLRATARQTATFRSIVASATDLVLLVRPDLRIAYASPSVGRMVGHDVGTALADLLHPDDRAGVLAWLTERSSSLGERGYRCRFRTADGGWRDVELRAQDRTADPAVRGLVLNGRDVTHELALEDRLGHARKLAMLSEMAGRIAHAFNNTLAALQGHAEVLSRDLPADATAQQDARAIRAAAERGAGITRQLLGFTGRHVIQPTTMRPTSVVEALRPTLARLLGRGHQLEVVATDHDVHVNMDRAQLEQVLVNLVANARDAMPDGGTVTIAVSRVHTTAAEPESVEIAVRDQGMGIPTANLPHVLKPFFTTKAPGQGTGLGLAMVDAIARRAGGEVAITSEPGRGSTVALRLPSVPSDGPSVTPPAATTEPATAERAIPRHVLLVDDDALVRSACERILARAGYNVYAAEDGASALRVAEDRSVPIDLLLTDLMMPGLSGREVIERFRPLRPGVPVVCMTGYASQREDGRAAAIATVEIVAKPFTSATLLRAIDDALRVATTQGARSPGR